ncbi:hypothetical protein [Rhizobium sullae]|uniref:Uncharacterized protein n=1 Tax=Rhizobium sullae TaxID=50338 RepID=A0A4R3Q0D4_RHISU|nr:hypothetical protein [Rhizobium sullae]TCU14460.1 hypothetical protein EV132_109183 [Rhizobium sullae]
MRTRHVVIGLVVVLVIAFALLIINPFGSKIPEQQGQPPTPPAQNLSQ